ncbi:MAG: type II toxin-antitoxin system RelE/ParE family toxin [Candidatus Tectomicrobia bacterium]|nr:type II toxin-antitoxin system RelE/ParE family toxin [Candidatus Tectomicrobia bacterium]
MSSRVSEESPRHGKKFSGVKSGQWRVRVGEYRIRYDIRGNRVHLHRVRRRGESYRD